MEGDSLVDFNFWPSFADLMLATVFVLVLVIFLIAFTMQLGSVGIEPIRKEQHSVARSIQARYGDSLETREKYRRYVVWKDGREDVHINNDIQLQRITFSDNVLFAPERYNLTSNGREVLSEVGSVIKEHLDAIYKIDIEGHTDTVPTYRYEGGNLELGALRAIAVMQFFHEQVGIDPVENLISATSYGEFNPTEREGIEAYSEEALGAANATERKRSRNRRVELLLFYRQNFDSSQELGDEASAADLVN